MYLSTLYRAARFRKEREWDTFTFPSLIQRCFVRCLFERFPIKLSALMDEIIAPLPAKIVKLNFFSFMLIQTPH